MWQVPAIGKKSSISLRNLFEVATPNETGREERRETVNKMMCAPNKLENIQGAYEKSTRDTGAICLPPDPYNLLMWSHYAIHHRGFALQFHTANDVRKMGLLLKVDYSHNYPHIDWFDNNFKIEAGLRTKHRGWEYEQEFRIIIVDGAGTYLPFKPEALTGLIFGCRAEIELKKRVLNILEQRAAKNLSPLKVYKAIKHDREYKVTIQKDRSLNWPS